MDITTICKVIIVIGSLQTCSLYQVCQYAVGAVDGNLFQVPEMVEWAKAQQTCQKNNGTLFRPNETLCDVPLFSECNFNDDLWVAATYINITNVGSAFRGDSFSRCEMCEQEDSCRFTCFYKACRNRCNVVCKGIDDHLLVFHTPKNWTEAKQWCSGYAHREFGDKNQTASFLSQHCYPGCFWTRNVIQVQLQTEIAQGNESKECGILHNGTLSFTSCNRHLQPLCERVVAVDGNLFEVPEMVEWAEAEQACQKNNGKLFRPSETLFDVSLLSECTFNDDLWVAATYINITNVGSAFSGDSFIRCEMCEQEDSCRFTCLYKACGNQCNVLCKGLYDPVVHYTPKNWTEAKQWCSGYAHREFGDKNQTASFLSRHCYPGCFWTRNVIQVQLQTQIAQGNESNECGILHNGTLSFTSCNRHLQPLCERVAKTDLETPRHFSERNNSCILMNNTITYTTTAEASRRANRINATVITSSTNGTSTVANEIAEHTTIRINEERSSLLVPVGTTTSRNDLEDSHHTSDTGIIIGSVIGSVVFLILTVLVIICARRKVLQRIGGKKSKHDGKNANMHNTDSIDPNQYHDVPLETGSGFTVIAQLESNSEESHSSIVGTISDLRKPASFLDPEGSKFIYETLTRKVNVNSSNPNSNIDYDGYEHLNSVQERRDDNLTGNIYDTVQSE